jgi:hypothetical protein
MDHCDLSPHLKALTRGLLRNPHNTLTKGLCLRFDAKLYALGFSGVK